MSPTAGWALQRSRTNEPAGRADPSWLAAAHRAAPLSGPCSRSYDVLPYSSSTEPAVEQVERSRHHLDALAAEDHLAGVCGTACTASKSSSTKIRTSNSGMRRPADPGVERRSD